MPTKLKNKKNTTTCVHYKLINIIFRNLKICDKITLSQPPCEKAKDDEAIMPDPDFNLLRFTFI